MIASDGLLMIEPSTGVSETSVIDSRTRKMAAAWRQRRTSDYAYRGIHRCVCGAFSDNKDHWVVLNGQEVLTNSLCVHYLAFHRSEVPVAELLKAAALGYGEEEPNGDEMIGR